MIDPGREANALFEVAREDIAIACADGVTLAATLYTPAVVKAAVMIGPATGIRRRFYGAFATHLAERGYAVVTYDNRGIGDSRRGPPDRSDASLVSWGRMDMPAVLEKLRATFPDASYHLIGHSAGGQLVGLMHNARAFASMFNVAVSSGSLRNMRFPFSLKASFFLNVFIPVNNVLFGYTNAQWLDMGDPLPRQVAAQWRRWCNGRGYLATDFGRTIAPESHLYDRLTMPSLWLHATDDGIANAANVRDMIRVYSKLDARVVTLEPSELGFRDIGHMKFFKREPLWRHAVAWLDAHAPPRG